MNKLNAWLHPVIRGTFYDKVWDPETHNMYVAINQGHDLRNTVTIEKTKLAPAEL